jgi:hypothetical protein
MKIEEKDKQITISTLEQLIQNDQGLLNTCGISISVSNDPHYVPVVIFVMTDYKTNKRQSKNYPAQYQQLTQTHIFNRYKNIIYY